MTRARIPASCADLDLFKVRRLLIKHHCNISAVAKKLGVPITDLRLTALAVPALINAALEAEEQALDEAEAVIRSALRGDDAAKRIAAAGAILRTSVAKRRGFGS
jgi:regulator of protease activity HflC (stomatin/prohibitin superfamily)